MASSNEADRWGFLDELEIVVLCEDSALYESRFLGQHGISLLARARSGPAARSVLMDVGQDPRTLLGNLGLMGIEPSEIDTVVLTHCHFDHTRGLAEILRAIGKTDLPVVAHPSLFRPNFITVPFLRHVGVGSADSAERLREAGARLFLAADPLQLMPGLFTTGEVRRQTDYEEVGIGGLSTIENGRVRRDEMIDDLSIVARVRGHAPLIMTGCSHAGIVNIAKQAAEMCGTRRFENVLGGFHLAEATEERIAKTCAGLAEYEWKALTPGHCTGFRAQAALYSTFGEVFRPLQTGMRIRVTAAD